MFLENDNGAIVVNISFDKSKDFKARIPMKMYIDSAGYDLFADESFLISKWSRATINTSMCFQIPKDFYGEIKSRSGLEFKNGLFALNGTIDAGYTGFVYVLLFNNSDTDYNVKKGDRIAQVIFRKCHSVSFRVCEFFTGDTDRGVKGFGSSGV